MPQSVARVSVHIVYSTKHRKPWLDSIDLRSELYAYKATILKNNVDSPAIVIGGVEDHIHALCLLSRKFAIMKVIEEMKKETTKWLKRKDNRLSEFAWQSGYGVFGVSESNIPRVRSYIENQVQHHKRITFKDEFRAICQKHSVNLDERYAWD